MNERVIVGLKKIPDSMKVFRVGIFNDLEPDDVFLDPKISSKHELEFWYFQLENKLFGDPYYKISGIGMYKVEIKNVV